MKRIAVFLLVLVLLCGCSAGTRTAFTVNGLAVEKDELVFYMNRSLDVVVADVETTYGLDSTEDGFWEAPAGDTTPLEILKTTAVRHITRTKLEMLCARENGVSTLPLQYSAQKSAWKEDNDNRQRMEAEGELVYGQVLRSFYTYFQDEFLTMRDTLLWKLEGAGVISATEAEKRAYYDAHREELTQEYAAHEPTIRYWLLTERYEAYFDQLAASAEIGLEDMTVDPSRLS